MPTPKRSVTLVSKDGTRCIEFKFRQFIKTPDGVEVSGPVYLNGEFIGPGTGTLNGVDFYDKKRGRKKGCADKRILYALASLAAQVVFGDKPTEADSRVSEILQIDPYDVGKARRHKDFHGFTALVNQKEDGTILAIFWDGTAQDDREPIPALLWKPPSEPSLVTVMARTVL